MKLLDIMLSCFHEIQLALHEAPTPVQRLAGKNSGGPSEDEKLETLIASIKDLTWKRPIAKACLTGGNYFLKTSRGVMFRRYVGTGERWADIDASYYHGPLTIPEGMKGSEVMRLFKKYAPTEARVSPSIEASPNTASWGEIELPKVRRLSPSGPLYASGVKYRDETDEDIKIVQDALDQVLERITPEAKQAFEDAISSEEMKDVQKKALDRIENGPLIPISREALLRHNLSEIHERRKRSRIFASSEEMFNAMREDIEDHTREALIMKELGDEPPGMREELNKLADALDDIRGIDAFSQYPNEKLNVNAAYGKRHGLQWFPCPFCGSLNLAMTGHGDLCEIYCECSASVNGPSIEKAVARWNERHIP